MSNKTKATLSADKQSKSKNWMGIFDLNFAEKLEPGETILVDESVVNYIEKQDGKKLSNVRLEITDKDGEQFDANFNKLPNGPKYCKHEIVIQNGIFSEGEVKNLITTFKLRKANQEEFRDFLNDMLVNFILFKQSIKKKSLMLEAKKKLFCDLEEKINQMSVVLNTLYKQRCDDTFFSLYNYDYFSADIFNHVKKSEALDKDVIKKIEEDLSKLDEMRYPSKKAISTTALDARQSFLGHLRSLINSTDDNLLNSEINSKLRDHYQHILFYETESFIKHIQRFFTIVKFFEKHLAYVRSGNTSKQHCWPALWSLRQIYKDYFCTTEIAAQRVEQNVQHIEGDSDAYKDSDVNEGQLLKFIYQVMHDVKNKTRIKIWEKDVFGKNLLLTREDAINSYKLPK